MSFDRSRWVTWIAALSIASAASGEEPWTHASERLYRRHCASCHAGTAGGSRAPGASAARASVASVTPGGRSTVARRLL